MNSSALHTWRARRIALLALVALGTFPALAGASAHAPAAGVGHLIDRERAFARAAVEKGVRESFLEFIAEDGIIFVPLPVAGRPLLAASPPIAGRLEWTPVFAGIAASGDLGFTTGPYSMSAGKTVTTGQYLTIWRKGADGSWRFVLDRGTPGPTDLGPHVRTAVALLHGVARPRTAARNTDEVLQAELALSVASEASADAIGGLLAPGARLLREGSTPAVTSAARGKLLRDEPVRVAYHVLGSGISGAGDLAYTYGDASWDNDGAPVKGHFVRMWQRHGSGWRIVVDSRSEVPHPRR